LPDLSSDGQEFATTVDCDGLLAEDSLLSFAQPERKTMAVRLNRRTIDLSGFMRANFCPKSVERTSSFYSIN
jgi:hypothetical protein